MNAHAEVHAPAHHGPSTRLYLLIFGILALFTAITVGISYSGLSHTTKETLAFVIATIKAFLVALIFMHLRYERRYCVVFAIAPVILALIFIIGIAPDVGSVRD